MSYLLNRLNEWVLESGKVVSDSIINIDTLLNHRIDTTFSSYAGVLLAQAVRDQHIDVVLTAEASGISVAVFTAMAINNAQWPRPADVVFAKKSRPITLPEGGYYKVDSFSRTKNRPVELYLGSHVIPAGSNVYIVDDFLAQGTTLAALAELGKQSGGHVAAFGVVLEKTFESGRQAVAGYGAPLFSLVKVTSLAQGRIELAPPSLD